MRVIAVPMVLVCLVACSAEDAALSEKPRRDAGAEGGERQDDAGLDDSAIQGDASGPADTSSGLEAAPADASPADGAGDAAVPCGTPTSFAASSGGAVALDSTHVYWTNEGVLLRRAKTGGAITELARLTDVAHTISVDASHVYATVRGSACKVPLDGSQMVCYVGGSDAEGLALTPTRFYWVDGLSNALFAEPNPGSSASRMGTITRPVGLAYVAGSPGWFVAASGTNLVAASLQGGAQVLTAAPSSVDAIAVVGTAIYARVGGGDSAKTTIITSDGVTLASGWQQSQFLPVGIAADETHVYWNNTGYDGSVMKVSVTGGSTTTIAEHQTLPQGLAIDDTRIYWTTSTDVMVACK